MRLRILEDTATVGQMMKKGEVHEVQAMLADALIASGKAEDAFKIKAPKAPEPVPEKPEIVIPEVKKIPAKKKPSKKSARKKAK